MKEISCFFKDSNTQMNVESWGDRGNEVLIVIPSVGHLRYAKFKQNCKSSNFVNQSLDVLPNNMEKSSSSVITLCYYLADDFEGELTSAAGEACLNFSSEGVM